MLNKALTHLFSYLHTEYKRMSLKMVTYLAEYLAKSQRLNMTTKLPMYSGN